MNYLSYGLFLLRCTVADLLDYLYSFVFFYFTTIMFDFIRCSIWSVFPREEKVFCSNSVAFDIKRNG